MSKRITEIASRLKAADKIALFSHLSPDGDTIGSGLALYGALRSLGKTVCLCCDGKTSKNIQSLPWIDRILEKPDFQADLAMAIDCADRARLGACLDSFEQAAFRIVIDHHGSNRGFGDLDWIVPEAAATAELIYSLITALDLPITADIASCLYAGLASDTGNFSYANTSQESFRIAAELMKSGFELSKLSRSMFRVRSKGYAHMLGLVSRQMRFFEEDRVLLALLDQTALGDYPFESGDSEGIVDFMRDQEGVCLAAFGKEMPEGGAFKISLRATGNIDVSAIAAHWGGGGHKGAAGTLIQGDVFSVGAELLAAIRKHLERKE